MQTRIILIRHGQTKANLEKRYIGVTESCLTSYGRYQAKSLKKRIAKEKVDKVFVSPSKRAFDFSKIVFTGSERQVLTGLREMDFGIFEGLTHSQVIEEYPQVYDKWLKNPKRFNIPKAELFSDFKARVLRALKKIICENAGCTVAIVTHGGPIRIILGKVLKLNNLWEIMPHLASISIIEFNSLARIPRAAPVDEKQSGTSPRRGGQKMTHELCPSGSRKGKPKVLVFNDISHYKYE